MQTPPITLALVARYSRLTYLLLHCQLRHFRHHHGVALGDAMLIYLVFVLLNWLVEVLGEHGVLEGFGVVEAL